MQNLRLSEMQYLVDTVWVIDYQHERPRTVALLDGLLSNNRRHFERLEGLNIISA